MVPNDFHRTLFATTSRVDEVRAEARRRVEALAPSAADLIAALRHHDARIRSGAAWAIGLLDAAPDAIEALRSTVLEDPSSWVVEAAIDSLGRLRATAAAAEVADCVEDTNAHVAHAAIRTLGLIGDAASAARLMPVLHSEARHLRMAATTALARLGHRPASGAILDILRGCLASSRTTPADNEARECISALGRLGATDAADLMLEIANSPDGVGLRSVAVEALLALGVERAAPAVVGLLADPGQKLFTRLVRLIAEADFRGALPSLRPLLRHPRPYRRLAALDFVARWRDEASLAEVRRMALSDPSPLVRPRAVGVLAQLAGAAAVADLSPLLADTNGDVRRAAEFAFERLGLAPPAVAPEGGERTRLYLFASHALGRAVFDGVAEMREFDIVGVATDYPWGDADRLVPARAAAAGLPVYTGRVDHDGFQRHLEAARPDAIILAGYSQRLPSSFVEFVGGRVTEVTSTTPEAIREALRPSAGAAVPPA